MGAGRLTVAVDRVAAQDGEHIVGIISAPALEFIALWLEPEEGSGGDGVLVMPFPPNATPLADCEAVAAAEALEVLQSLRCRAATGRAVAERSQPANIVAG